MRSKEPWGFVICAGSVGIVSSSISLPQAPKPQLGPLRADTLRHRAAAVGSNIRSKRRAAKLLVQRGPEARSLNLLNPNLALI